MIFLPSKIRNIDLVFASYSGKRELRKSCGGFRSSRFLVVPFLLFFCIFNAQLYIEGNTKFHISDSAVVYVVQAKPLLINKNAISDIYSVEGTKITGDLHSKKSEETSYFTNKSGSQKINSKFKKERPKYASEKKVKKRVRNPSFYHAQIRSTETYSRLTNAKYVACTRGLTVNSYKSVAVLQAGYSENWVIGESLAASGFQSSYHTIGVFLLLYSLRGPPGEFLEFMSNRGFINKNLSI